MKNPIKAAFISVGILSLMGLTACQSPQKPTESKHHMQQKGDHDLRHKGERSEWHGRSRDHHERSDRNHHRTPLTAEQKADVEKKRAERHAQHQAKRQILTQACEGKVGQTVSVKIGEKTIEGSCELQFRPTRSDRTIRPVPNTTTPSTPVATS